MAQTLARGEQAIVLLNRRGFASSVFCRQCGATLECPNCSVSLTVHRAAQRARCHYCNHSIAAPEGVRQLRRAVHRAGRVSAPSASRPKSARCSRRRASRASTATRFAGAARSPRCSTRFAARELDVLVGTQMIAKGHDFPRVTLVGVISADVGLGLADFRAAERTFQLLTQVAGRAGRGEIRGQAIVQTLFPNHYSIQHACRQDYAAFFEEELKFRQAMHYPPAVALVNVVVKGRTQQGAQHDAGDLVQALRIERRAVSSARPGAGAAQPPERRAPRAVLHQGHAPRAMRQALLAALATRPELKRRTIVDVDPMSVL